MRNGFRRSEHADLPALARWVTYFDERGELESQVSGAVTVALRKYQPTVMDFLIEHGAAKYPGQLPCYAGQSADNPEWLAYFVKKGALADGGSFMAFREAIQARKTDAVKALVAAGADVNRVGADNQTPIFLAVGLRNLAIVQALVAGGADLSVKDVRKNTPADYAAQLRLIPALRILDRAGKHRELLENFGKEFPAKPSSAFLGQWTNGREGFSTIVVRFDPDGTAIFAASLMGALIAWHEKSDHEVEAFLFSPENGELLRSVPLIFRLNTTGDELSFERPNQPSEKMKRMAASR